MKAFLVPPHTYEETEGKWSIADMVYVCAHRNEDDAAARVILAALSQMGSSGRLPGRMTTGSCRDGRQRVRLIRDKHVTDPEGYRIYVTPEEVAIHASAAAGTFYGAQTLAEMIEFHGRRVPCCRIEDAPDLRRRGFYLDCSRGKVPTIETVKQLIQRLARWKINELQLYVENVFTFARHPSIGQGFSPFTPEDILEIDAHAKRYHVKFVPSLTSLGHFEKILMLDEYSDLGELPGFRDLPGGTTICPVDERSIRLVGDMYDEYLPLFSTDDFNACGDEPWELGQGRSKETAEEKGAGSVYLDFILKLYDLSLQHGKRMNIWGDIVLKHPEIIPDIPSDMVLLNWDYRPDGRMMTQTDKFADAGVPLVCCPGTNSWQSHGTRLDQAIADIGQFAGIALEYGAEGLLNTDWGDGGHRNLLGVSLLGAAFGGAHGWNHDGVAGMTTEEFIRSYCLHTFADLDGSVDQFILTTGDGRYGYWAYHALLESLSEAKGFGRDFCRARPVIDEVELTDAEMTELAEKTASLDDGTSCLDAYDEQFGEERRFERIALEEYVLANRMNKAALNRLGIARTIRAGGNVEQDRFRKHETELMEIRDDFQKLWLNRSRISRLEDNLSGFDAGIAELRSLLES
jgi:hexosaminidase